MKFDVFSQLLLLDLSSNCLTEFPIQVKDIKEIYSFNKRDDHIGQGSFGTVVKAINQKDKETYALKLIKK